MKKLFLSFFFVFLIGFVNGQSLDEKIFEKEAEIGKLQEKTDVLRSEIEEIKLERLRKDLRSVGLPSDNYIEGFT